MSKSMEHRLAVQRAGEPSKEALEKARRIWDEITDDDECCIGHPEGAEYVEEAIVPKLARLLDSFAAQARLEEAKYWQKWYSTQDLGGWTLAFKKRIAALGQERGENENRS